MNLSGAPVFTPVFNPAQSVLTLALPMRVRSEVVFGTPSKNCSGNGICMLSQHRMDSRFSGPCPKTQCWVRINPVRQAVYLEFDRHTLTEEMMQKHFASSHFSMEEDVRIPLSISKKWGISGRIVLQSGRYPILKQDGKITLVLQYCAASCH